MRRVSAWLVPAGIVVLFFGPLLLAVLMRSGWWSWEPLQKTNHGRLLDPPLHLELQDPTLAGKWVLLYVYETDCAATCERDIASLRRVREANGRHRDRIATAALPAEGPGAGALPGGPGHAFVLDPAGNIILVYSPDFDPNDINRDLKSLLTWSQQGKRQP